MSETQLLDKLDRANTALSRSKSDWSIQYWANVVNQLRRRYPSYGTHT